MEETIDALIDPDALADIREADAAYKRGDVLRGCRRHPQPAIVTTSPELELVLTPPAQPAIAEEITEAVAAALIDFLTTALVTNPRRVGKPLRDDLVGIW